MKGHDFPNVTLVAVMRADLSLYEQDYKASENTFSMITQCIGRSGRKLYGESIIQAYDTDSFTLNIAKEQDFEKFYSEEIKNRKKLYYPPFSTLLKVSIYCDLENVLDDAVNNLKILLDSKNKVDATILGPTKSNPEKIKDAHYRSIIIKCKNKVEAKQFRTLIISFINYIDKIKIIKLLFDIE